LRKDIQALRAFAVLAVFAYHMRPEWITGGFSGVDVFFVVSGFLISSHLLKELRETGSIKFLKFWSRRARRLLPASFVVLGFMVVTIWLVAPQALQQRFFRDVSAASLYVANWVFAADSTDYLSSQNSPSIAQHFWSLGVEEQIYLAWPLILLGGWRLFSALRKPLVSLMLLVGGLSLISIVYSAFLVFRNDPSGYFSTFSRVWEFGLGALVAALGVFRLGLVPTNPRLASTMAWSGWIALVGFALLFRAELGFPGLWALIPTVATCLIILANSEPAKYGLGLVINNRVTQFLGDTSYSIYLWHWPLLIIAGFYFPRIPWYWLALIFAVTIGASYLTTQFVERPFRFGPFKTLPPAKVFAATATIMVLLVSSSQVGTSAVAKEIASQERATIELERAVTERVISKPPVAEESVNEKVWDEISCMGPAFLVEQECAEFRWDIYLPPVGAFDRTAHEIEPLAMSGSKVGCLAWKDRYDLITCTYGVLGGEKWVLIGDSHAYQWLPALNTVAKNNNIELHLMARAGCPPNSAKRNAEWDHQQGCISWFNEVKQWFAENPDVEKVIFGSFAGTTFLGAVDKWTVNRAAVSGFKDAWQELSANGAEVIVIRDTPFIGEETYACIERNAEYLERCDQMQQDLERVADNAWIAAIEERLPVVDMWDYFCKGGVCQIVVGGIRVYKDSNHFSGTYGLLLAPYLEEQLFEKGLG
jgi:peptidoglycan/LPS O-acetylase OafA/YrhL